MTSSFLLDPAYPLPYIKLRKVFKVNTLSPDFGVGKSKKSYKMGLGAAKYS
jgi:hypothetical protein